MYQIYQLSAYRQCHKSVKLDYKFPAHFPSLHGYCRVRPYNEKIQNVSMLVVNKIFWPNFFFEFCKILSISCWHNFRQQYSTQDLNISHTIFLALYRILCIINLEKGKIDSLSLNFKATFKHWNFFPTYH